MEVADRSGNHSAVLVFRAPAGSLAGGGKLLTVVAAAAGFPSLPIGDVLLVCCRNARILPDDAALKDVSYNDIEGTF